MKEKKNTKKGCESSLRLNKREGEASKQQWLRDESCPVWHCTYPCSPQESHARTLVPSVERRPWKT
jgi:tRNA uridine 5-carbamoylmethylation protein Kti12